MKAEKAKMADNLKPCPFCGSSGDAGLSPLISAKEKTRLSATAFPARILTELSPKNKFFVCILLMPESRARRQKFRFSSFRGNRAIRSGSSLKSAS